MTNTPNHKPLILITNDDGYQAKGLRKLIALMKPLGELFVISTDKVMSAKSHSITTSPTLTATLVESGSDYREYVCNGTPVDCVKLAAEYFCPRRCIDARPRWIE